MTRGQEPDWLRREAEELLLGLGWAQRGARQGFAPAVDVVRLPDPPEVVVEAELAGVDPGDVELSFADGFLTLEGVRRRPARERAAYQQIEVPYGGFQRRIEVGDDVDPSRAEAVYERGILTVRIPLVARRQEPVRVSITVVRRT